MRKIWILISLIFMLFLFQGCSSGWDTETIAYRGPNWTSDNKIVFVREKIIWHNWQGWAGEGSEVKRTEISLCEIDNDGSSYEQIGMIYETEGGEGYSPFNVSTSSVGDWVVIGWGRIFVMRRNGTDLVEICDGSYPDFSPDASQIVYQKPNQGIWIMDRDGGNEHAVWSDSLNKMPSWSSDGARVAFVRYEGWQDEDLWIMDINGSNQEKIQDGTRAHQPDWSPVDSNAIVCSVSGQTRVIYLDTINTRELEGAYTLKWSPSGAYFTGIDEEGIFVMEVDGSNKIHIQP